MSPKRKYDALSERNAELQQGRGFVIDRTCIVGGLAMTHSISRFAFILQNVFSYYRMCSLTIGCESRFAFILFVKECVHIFVFKRVFVYSFCFDIVLVYSISRVGFICL